MKTPAWLMAAGLIFWGFAIAQPAVGIGLAGLMLIVALLVVRFDFHPVVTDEDLCRVVDLSSIAAALTVLGLLSARGLPAGLLQATGWLPAPLFLLALLAVASEQPLRARHLAWSLRKSSSPQANQVIDIKPAYMAVLLLSSGILATQSPWFFWGVATLLLLWLWLAAGASRRWPAFLVAALLATGGGHLLGGGLAWAHVALEQWFIDTMMDSETDPYQSQTRIGDVGRVKLGDRIVWRVTQSPPVSVPLLMRSGVFTQFDGRAWTARQDAFKPVSAGAVGPGHMLIRGESHKGAVLLPVPIDAEAMAATAPGSAGRIERNVQGIVRLGEAPPLVQVAVARNANAKATPPGALETTVPPRYARLLERLPELAALRSRSEAERLAGVAQWFAANFRYTLFLGDEQQGKRDMERFLLHDRAGHCEYFGAATVLLLRSLGIPARYVTGYSVMEYSKLERAFIVRQKHAHAWAEAYVDGRWVDVDNTPANWVGIEEETTSPLRPAWDVLAYAWWRITELRHGASTGARNGVIALLALLAVLKLTWPTLRRLLDEWRQRQRNIQRSDGAAKAEVTDQESNALRRIEAEMAGLGLGRGLAEPARAWLVRIRQTVASTPQGSPAPAVSAVSGGIDALAPEKLDALHRLIEAVYRQRYASGEDRV